MKKGCFFGGIIFLTIAIGVGSYLFRKYYPEIKSFGKEKLVEVGYKGLKKNIGELHKSVYNDSLKVLLDNQIKLVEESDFDNSMKDLGRFIDQSKYFMKDKMIDSTEFSILKNMAMNNERSAKNRN